MFLDVYYYVFYFEMAAALFSLVKKLKGNKHFVCLLL